MVEAKAKFQGGGGGRVRVKVRAVMRGVVQLQVSFQGTRQLSVTCHRDDAHAVVAAVRHDQQK